MIMNKIIAELFDEPCPIRRKMYIKSQTEVIEQEFDWIFQGKVNYMVRDPYKLKPYCVVTLYLNIAKENEEICLVEHRFDNIIYNSTIIKLLAAKERLKYPPTKIIVIYRQHGIWHREDHPISLNEYKNFEKEVYSHAKNINHRDVFPFRSEKCLTCEFKTACKLKEAI